METITINEIKFSEMRKYFVILGITCYTEKKRRDADMVERKEYLDQLWAWKDEQQIKVVTGIRCCGKSVLLEQYQQRLLANSVASEQIISINFENLDYEPLKDYMKLYNYLKERLCADKMTYIFLDEVQEVTSFEKVVDSLYIRDNVDVYKKGA